MNIDQIIGNNIKKYRVASNMTLKEISEKLHKSISTISKYEKGDISLDIPTFMEISKILNIPPALLLNSELSIENIQPEYSSLSETLYMYTYDSQSKTIINSVIEQYKSISENNNKYKVILFNDVKDFNCPEKCDGFYKGEYTENIFLGTYILKNQNSIHETVLISCVNNLTNSNQKICLISGLSNYTMLPVTFKALISGTKITNKEFLMEILSFSKEDFKLMKKNHYITIQNLK